MSIVKLSVENFTKVVCQAAGVRDRTKRTLNMQLGTLLPKKASRANFRIDVAKLLRDHEIVVHPRVVPNNTDATLLDITTSLIASLPGKIETAPAIKVTPKGPEKGESPARPPKRLVALPGTVSTPPAIHTIPEGPKPGESPAISSHKLKKAASSAKKKRKLAWS